MLPVLYHSTPLLFDGGPDLRKTRKGFNANQCCMFRVCS